MSRRKMGQRLLAGAVALATGLGLSFAAAAPASADVTSNEQAIVQLYQQFTVTAHFKYQDGTSSDPFGLKLGYSCTGTFVSAEGDILTAGHCVDPGNVSQGDVQNQVIAELEAAGKDQATAEAYANATVVTDVKLNGVIAYQPKEVGGVLDADGFQVQVVAFKPVDQGDYALLRLNNFAKATPFLRLASAEPTIQQHITAIGFPGVVADTSDAGRQRVSYPDGKVISFPTQYGLPWVQVSVDLQHGMSGGPVVDDENNIVGTVSWGHRNQSGDEAKYITTLRGVKDFLKGNGVDVESAPAPQATPATTDGPQAGPLAPTEPAGSDNGPLVPVLIGVIVLLVVVAGAGLVVVSRKKKTTPNSPPPPGTPPAPPTAQ